MYIIHSRNATRMHTHTYIGDAFHRSIICGILQRQNAQHKNHIRIVYLHAIICIYAEVEIGFVGIF